MRNGVSNFTLPAVGLPAGFVAGCGLTSPRAGDARGEHPAREAHA